MAALDADSDVGVEVSDCLRNRDVATTRSECHPRMSVDAENPWKPESVKWRGQLPTIAVLRGVRRGRATVDISMTHG
jgi:hypothetical protein